MSHRKNKSKKGSNNSSFSSSADSDGKQWPTTTWHNSPVPDERHNKQEEIKRLLKAEKVTLYFSH